MQNFLLVYDRRKGAISALEEFSEQDREKAHDRRLQQELAHAQDPNVEVVLLRADSLDDLKITHANYFQSIAQLLLSKSTPVKSVRAATLQKGQSWRTVLVEWEDGRRAQVDITPGYFEVWNAWGWDFDDTDQQVAQCYQRVLTEAPDFNRALLSKFTPGQRFAHLELYGSRDNVSPADRQPLISESIVQPGQPERLLSWSE